jgi:hypothetical protein
MMLDGQKLIHRHLMLPLYTIYCMRLPANLPSLESRSCLSTQLFPLLLALSLQALPQTATRPASHSLSHLLSSSAPHANRRLLLLGATSL